jgi:hypothetical protein
VKERVGAPLTKEESKPFTIEDIKGMIKAILSSTNPDIND